MNTRPQRPLAGWSLCFAAMIAATGVMAQESATDPGQIAESVKKSQPERNPVVRALLASNPKTPSEWFELAVILNNEDRPKLAKEYLKKIVDANLDASQLLELADRFGQAAFVRLAARRALLPEADTLADAVVAAAGGHRETPEQLAALVDQLASPDEQARDKAIVALREAGPTAVAPLVAALADPARAEEHARLRQVLASLGSDATRPLLAYLEASDPKFVAQVIGALAQIDDRESLLHLLAPFASLDSDQAVRQAAAAALSRRVGQLPTSGEAAKILADRARRYFDGQTAVVQDENGRTTIWQWDAKAQKAVAKTYPAAVARAILAARLAGEALLIVPNDAAVRRLYLLTTLEAAAYEAGLDEPLLIEPGTPLARAAEFGAAELLTALDEAISTGHGPAAAAAAQVLGQTATAEDALNVGPTASPLALALRSPDRRTRAAAVEAIARLRPSSAFPGASYLGESMAFLAGSTGARRAMVAARNTAEAGRVGGYLSQLGYDVDTAVTGRELIGKLLKSPDYELVLIDARIDLPPITMLVQQLRRDGRTATLPVGILGTEDFYKRAQRVARDDPLTLALVRPHDADTVRWQVDRLKQLSAMPVPADVRKQQATEVLGQLAALTVSSPGVLDLSRVEQAVLGAARSPEMASGSLAALEKLGTPESQQTLVGLASDSRQSELLRRAALSALTRNVEQFGVLLTTRQILKQYDRYNASATADEPTRQIRGLILDCLEAGSRGSGVRDQESGAGEQ